MYVCLLPRNSAPLQSTPQMILILNQHDLGSAVVYNSFALHVTLLYVEKFLFDASYEVKYTITYRKLV